ncbi:unnamed protein product [Aphanomyces euteiches]|nr:hypothetical protein Ae201684P_015873 [Aphanomyces euteiches]KAH9149414.1 hypothetical protein AeRB84_007507 [Aphanomyces euteiches]
MNVRLVRFQDASAAVFDSTISFMELFPPLTGHAAASDPCFDAPLSKTEISPLATRKLKEPIEEFHALSPVSNSPLRIAVAHFTQPEKIIRRRQNDEQIDGQWTPWRPSLACGSL